MSRNLDGFQMLELKVPTVAVVLCIGALMWLASWALPAFGFSLPARHFISLSLAVAGLVIGGSGVVSSRVPGQLSIL